MIGAGELAPGENKFRLDNGTVSFIGCHFDDCALHTIMPCSLTLLWFRLGAALAPDSDCVRRAGDNHLDQEALAQPCVKAGGCWTQRGTAAFDQRSGQLLLSGNEFVDPYQDYKLAKPGTRHVSVGPAARKTLIVGNILNAGVLNVTRAAGGHGKVVIANNVDDSPAPNDLQTAAAMLAASGGGAVEAALRAAAFRDKMEGLAAGLAALPPDSDEATAVRQSIAALAANV